MGPRQDMNSSDGGFMNSKEEDTTIDSFHPKFSDREAKVDDSILATSLIEKKNAVIVNGEEKPLSSARPRYQDRDQWRRI